jgi:hypothetical protein
MVASWIFWHGPADTTTTFRDSYTLWNKCQIQKETTQRRKGRKNSFAFQVLRVTTNKIIHPVVNTTLACACVIDMQIGIDNQGAVLLHCFVVIWTGWSQVTTTTTATLTTSLASRKKSDSKRGRMIIFCQYSATVES